MIPSPNHSARGTAPVRLIVVHTAEGAKTVAELGNYFAKASVQASSHVGIDDQGLEQYVSYAEAAWTIRSANPISDNAELCGFAAWTRTQWITDHHPMLEHAAAWIRGRCLARGIPIVRLTPAQVGAGHAGVCGHVDWTLGTGDGTHTDPGPGFPWDVVIAMAAQLSPVPVAAPRVLEDDHVYIRCQLNPSGPESVAILVGSMFVGLGSANELADAKRAMDGGAPYQWVERATWAEFDKRSHALCANPRPVLAVAPTAPAATS